MEQQEPQVDERSGFVPFAMGRDVHVDRGGGAVLIARRDFHLTRGGGQWLVALGDQTVEQGGGGVLISREARVSNGFVAVAIAGRLSLEGTARALVTLSLPVAAAAVAGLGLGLLLGRAGRHRRRAGFAV